MKCSAVTFPQANLFFKNKNLFSSENDDNTAQVWDEKANMSESLEKVLEQYLPKKVHDDVRTIIYGRKTKELEINSQA